MGRTPCCEKNGLKKGPWTPEEDKKLVDYIQRHGHGSWRSLPKRAELLRCGKSCRLRWTNYLRPDIKRGNFSFEEEHMIIELHALLGNKWSAIAASLPGRTDNEIKNYWNTHLRKRLLQMGIDPVTHRPRTDILGFSNMQSPFVSPALSCHMLQLENARLEEYLKLVTAHETVNMAAADCGNVFMMPLNPQLGDSMNKSVFNSVADPGWPAQPAIANSDYNGLIPQNLGQTVQPKKVDTECLINQINAHSSLIQDQEGSVSSFLDSACSSGVGKSSSSSLQIDHVQHAISPMDGMQLKIKHEMILQGHGRILNDKPCEAKMNATANMKVLHDNSTLMDGDYIAPTQQAGNSYARAIPPELMLKLAENSSAQQNAVAIGLASSISTGVAAPFSSELNSQDAKDYWRIILKSVETKPSDPPAVRSATSQRS